MDLALNSDWDISVDINDLAIVDDTEAIDQHIQQRLGTFLGEYYLDNRVGVPYLQQILVKNPDTQIMTSAFTRTILNTPGVLELISLDMDLNNATRVLTVSGKIQTSSGVSDFTIEVP